jgi:SAM-dependent methyltransferase
MKNNQDYSLAMSDIDDMMYRCGVDILHPGGLEKTLELIRDCHVSKGSSILDVGSGKGVTAILLARDFGCSVTGIDLSKDMVGYAAGAAEKQGLHNKITFRNLNAHELPFGDNTFDAVLAECSTVLMDKEKAFREFIRVVKPGGRVGDLEMVWRKPPPLELEQRAFDLWEGFSTKTFDGWREFFGHVGLQQVIANDFSHKLANYEMSYVRALGLGGIAKMLWLLAKNPRLRKGMVEYSRFFSRYREFIGYGYLVGSKKSEGK